MIMDETVYLRQNSLAPLRAACEGSVYKGRQSSRSEMFWATSTWLEEGPSTANRDLVASYQSGIANASKRIIRYFGTIVGKDFRQQTLKIAVSRRPSTRFRDIRRENRR